jgi:hypothetical protein
MCSITLLLSDYCSRQRQVVCFDRNNRKRAYVETTISRESYGALVTALLFYIACSGVYLLQLVTQNATALVRYSSYKLL